MLWNFWAFLSQKSKKKYKQEYLGVKVEIYLETWVEIRIPKDFLSLWIKNKVNIKYLLNVS